MKTPKTGYQPRPFPSWRTFTKQSAMYLTVGSLLILQTACGGNGDSYRISNLQDENNELRAQNETLRAEKEKLEAENRKLNPIAYLEAEEGLSKGTITTIQEKKHKQFEVVDEKIVDSPDSTRVIVKYLDGRVDTLTTAQVKKMLTNADVAAINDTSLRVKPSAKPAQSPVFEENYSPSMHTLGYVLLGSAMGYYLGKSLSTPPNPNVYRYPQQQYYSGYNMQKPPTYSGGSYASTNSYQNTSTQSSTSSRVSSPKTSYSSSNASSSSYSSPSSRPASTYSTLKSTSQSSVSRPTSGYYSGSGSSYKSSSSSSSSYKSSSSYSSSSRSSYSSGG